MKRLKVGAVLVGVLALVGCSSKPTHVNYQRVNVFEQDNRNYIHSVETARYGNDGLGGAAVLMPDVIHVLDDYRPVLQKLDFDTYENRNRLLKSGSILSERSGTGEKVSAAALEKAMKVIAELDASDTDARLSHYDLALWEAYCDGGKGMTDADWGKMIPVNTEQIPPALKSTCQPATIQLTDQIIAKFCLSEKLSNQELYAINSVGTNVIMQVCNQNL